MRTPTTAQLRTAIEVLDKLSEQINERAADSMVRLPETRFGDNHAARLKARAIEQTSSVEHVKDKLESWRRELLESRKQTVSHHV